MKNIILGIIAIAILSQAITAYAASISKKEQKNIINVHNMYRTMLKEQKLEWSEEIASSAQSWATILENNECTLAHSPPELRNNYGENIYAGWGTSSNYRISIKNGVYAWGKEKAYYQYPSNRCSPNQVCGHYTQMVWKDTKKIGCALARCSTAEQTTEILICQYDPPGNYTGRLPY